MKIKYSFLIIATFIIINCASAFAYDPNRKIKVSVTSSHIYCLLKEICGDKLDVNLVVPATVCPNSSTIDSVMVKKVASSNIILYHSWQEWAKNLKYNIGNLYVVYKELKTEGNLMIPYINIRAAEEITDMFSVLDADNKEFYENNLVKYVFRVNHISEQISKRASLKYHNKKIICNNKISDFMQWLGCDVVAEYGKSNNISSNQMIKLSKKAKENEVKYVIDNLQNGTDIGRTLSNDLKIKQVIISNFPLGNSYINTLKDNVLKIDKALQ